MPFRFVQQIPWGGLWVLPSAGVCAALLPPHGSDHRVLAGRHQVLPPRVLHLCPDRSLGREGELLTESPPPIVGCSYSKNFSLTLQTCYLNLNACQCQYFSSTGARFVWMLLSLLFILLYMSQCGRCDLYMFVCWSANVINRGLLSTFLTSVIFCASRWSFARWNDDFANICGFSRVKYLHLGCILRSVYWTANMAAQQFFSMATQGTAAKKSMRPKKHFPIDHNIKIGTSKTADRKTFHLLNGS